MSSSVACRRSCDDTRSCEQRFPRSGTGRSSLSPADSTVTLAKIEADGRPERDWRLERCEARLRSRNVAGRSIWFKARSSG